MGMIGAAIGNFAGGALGAKLGGKGGKKIGSAIGSVAGGFLSPYKNGGMVKGKKGKAVQILAHGQEWVLPIGVKPTKSQKAEITKRKKKAKK